MARVDLKKSCGLNIVYDGQELHFADMTFNEKLSVSVDEIRPQLLNQELTCPEIFYTKYKGVDQEGVYAKKKLALNVYLIEPNLAGIEFVKTKGSKVAKYPRMFEVVHGSATIIMQSYESKKDGGDIIISNLRKMQKAVVPPGYTVSITNPRQSLLILFEILPLDARVTTLLDDMNGMTYYIIRKNAKQEIVRNPVYKLVSNPRKVNWDKIAGDLNMTPKTPLIKQILRKYDKFKWIFDQNDFSV